MNGVHDLGGTDGLGPSWSRTASRSSGPSGRRRPSPCSPCASGRDSSASTSSGTASSRCTRRSTSSPRTTSTGSTPWSTTDRPRACWTWTRLDRRTQYYLEHPDAPLPQREDPDLVAFVEAVVPAGAPAKRESGKAARFTVGDTVTVRADSPIGHTRRARYIRGRTGEIVLAHGTFIYPDSAGNGGGDAPEHVYTVKFTNTELWGPDTAEPNGVVYFDVWEPYIVPAHTDRSSSMSDARPQPGRDRRAGQGARVDPDREGHHDHRGDRPAGGDLRERGRSAAGREGGGPGLGRPGFKQRLLADATKACAELRHRRPAGRGHGRRGEHRRRAQRRSSARCARATRGRCSACHRTGTRSRPTARGSSRSPARCCARTSATTLPDSVEVRVWDSSSEMRYWVLPTRPAGTDGLSEAELAGLVTRDSMIGVGPAASPVS